jgi:hypothetical protein
LKRGLQNLNLSQSRKSYPRRVRFEAINQDGDRFFGVHFIWGCNSYAAIPARNGYVRVYQLPNHFECNLYTERIEGMLNGLVRGSSAMRELIRNIRWQAVGIIMVSIVLPWVIVLQIVTIIAGW